MVKLQVLGNNSKTVNIKNLTWGKNDQHITIYLPCNFEVNLITRIGVIALFSSIFFILILFVLYFKNYKRQMSSLNCKNVQNIKIYLPCNFEVNPSTHFGVIALLHQILIVFFLYFKIFKRQMLSLNCKHVQYVKIYLPCNFEVNLITHLGVITLFQLTCHRLSSVVRPSTFHILIFSSETTGPIATKLWWNGPQMAPFQNCVR